MANRLHNLMALAAVIIIILVPAGADALNLGTLQKEQNANADPGNTLVFHLLFWNIESEQYTIALKAVSYPENWVVVASPKEFVLDSSPSGRIEYIYLPYLKKSVQAKAVDIFVQIPENTAGGKYNMALDAYVSKMPEGTINIVGQRRFSFGINVEGFSQRTDNNSESAGRAVIIENPGSIEQETSAPIMGMPEKETDKTLLFGALALILIMAWVIYQS